MMNDKMITALMTDAQLSNAECEAKSVLEYRDPSTVMRDGVRVGYGDIVTAEAREAALAKLHAIRMEQAARNWPNWQNENMDRLPAILARAEKRLETSRQTGRLDEIYPAMNRVNEIRDHIEHATA